MRVSDHTLLLCNCRYLTRGYPGCVWFHVTVAMDTVTKHLRETGSSNSKAFVEFKTSFGGWVGQTCRPNVLARAHMVFAVVFAVAWVAAARRTSTVLVLQGACSCWASASSLAILL